MNKTDEREESSNIEAFCTAQKTILRIRAANSRTQKNFLYNMHLAVIEASEASPSYAFQECIRPMWLAKEEAQTASQKHKI